MTNLKRGAEAEKKCCVELRKKGYHATRSAASKGFFDVIAVNREEVLFVQVKSTYNKYRRRQVGALKEILKSEVPDCKNIRRQMWCWVDEEGWYIVEVNKKLAIQLNRKQKRDSLGRYLSPLK